MVSAPGASMVAAATTSTAATSYALSTMTIASAVTATPDPSRGATATDK